MDEIKNEGEPKELQNNTDVPAGFTVDTGVELQSDKKPSGKKPVKKIVLAVLCVLLVLCIGVGVFGAVDYSGVTLNESVTVEIAKGTPAKQVAQILHKNGVINSELFFRVYCKVKHYDSLFKYGTYTFEAKMGYSAVCDKLMHEGASAPSVSVTIPEGTGINDYTKDVNGQKVSVPGIATLLEKAGVCKKNDFFEALGQVKTEGRLLGNVNTKDTYFPLEGYLFPDTYDFYYYDSKECAALAVEKMIMQANNKITDEMLARAEQTGYSVNQILTVASIVEMECSDAAEMKNVAAVFYNRLKSSAFHSLGSSPTCYYGNSFSGDDGRYNTYDIEGLPPGPLCSAGIAAIEAALDPTANSPYYYFVTDSKGKFYYHKTAGEQQNTINRLKQEGNWIYEFF